VLANFFRREAAETTLEIAEQTLGSISRTLRASRTLDLKVSPLVDVLHDSDLESKRTAITLLSRHATPEAIQVLRQLLSDPHPQIRSDASIALTRIEDELSKKLNAALEQWTADSTNPEHAVRLADAYYDYACSNLLDEVSERIYLEKARDLIQQVTAQSKSEAEQWMKLARIRQRLGEVTRALRDVSTAHQRSPQALEAYLLAMELAFSVGDWKRLTALAREGVSTLPAAPEAQTSLSWWANLPAEQHTVGIVHG
jgi:tetratricopeptide (TPR) repeat protein